MPPGLRGPSPHAIVHGQKTVRHQDGIITVIQPADEFAPNG